jgi:GNAT superfamily N-acetyltransferase
MSTSFSFLIRDGLASDIPACLALDSSYETEYVWQMSIQQEGPERQVMFKLERLPREMEVTYPTSPHRLRLALPREQCFLVAVGRDEPETLGYLTMRQDPAHAIAWVQDLVVARSFRRRRIGLRLLKVARQWAAEHRLARLMIETQTKNYPGITFCQKAGFTFCGFNDQYFQNQDIAVFFGQSLH